VCVSYVKKRSNSMRKPTSLCAWSICQTSQTCGHGARKLQVIPHRSRKQRKWTRRYCACVRVCARSDSHTCIKLEYPALAAETSCTIGYWGSLGESRVLSTEDGQKYIVCECATVCEERFLVQRLQNMMEYALSQYARCADWM
jgi:hypothetical protein